MLLEHFVFSICHSTIPTKNVFKVSSEIVGQKKVCKVRVKLLFNNSCYTRIVGNIMQLTTICEYIIVAWVQGFSVMFKKIIDSQNRTADCIFTCAVALMYMVHLCV